MLKKKEGLQILKEKPRVNEILNPDKFSNEYLANLPKNTLGFSYYTYMNSNGFKASERAKVKFVDDIELAYIMTRYREIHDFYHVLSGKQNKNKFKTILKKIYHQMFMEKL